ncbi:MAG TPA: hypothetical protein VJP59_09600 [Gemmatimonadota bacterium]|nr:hypothetical protein [Gemmatimonadota bacterium]
MSRRLPSPAILAALVVAVALTGSPASAQESVFNLPLPGLPAAGESVRSRGMGGVSAGLPGESFSLDNPAWIADFERAGLYLSLLGQRTTAEDADAEGEFEDVVFPMGQAAVPAFGAVIGVGYAQYLDFDAGIESSLVFEGDTVAAGLESEGGVGVLSPSLSLRLGERTGAGLMLDVYLGSREVVRSLAVPDPIGTQDTLARDFGGLGVALGVVRDLGASARVGVAYRLRPDLDTEVTRAMDPDLIGREAEIRLPDELLVEASVRVSEGLAAGAAARWAGWEGTLDEDLEGATTDVGDALDLGGGLEFAARRPILAVLGPDAPVRVGYRWRRLPLRLDGEPVSEWTLGLGYSRGFGRLSRVDAVLEIGARGDLQDHGVSERFVRVGVGMAVFEVWRRFD